jgi:hypothetical protein
VPLEMVKAKDLKVTKVRHTSTPDPSPHCDPVVPSFQTLR